MSNSDSWCLFKGLLGIMITLWQMMFADGIASCPHSVSFRWPESPQNLSTCVLAKQSCYISRICATYLIIWLILAQEATWRPPNVLIIDDNSCMDCYSSGKLVEDERAHQTTFEPGHDERVRHEFQSGFRMDRSSTRGVAALHLGTGLTEQIICCMLECWGLLISSSAPHCERWVFCAF